MGRIRKYTDEELIRQLKALAEELERTPTRSDIIRAHKEGKCAHWTAFYWWLGSLVVAQEEAGLIPNKVGNPVDYTPDELLLQYQELCVDLDKVANVNDIKRANKEGKCASHRTFYRKLKSIKNIRRRCGLRFRAYINKPLVGTIDEKKNKLIGQYKKLAKELKRTPTYEDVVIANRQGKCYSARAFYRIFGSFKKVAELLGLESSRPRKYKKR